MSEADGNEFSYVMKHTFSASVLKQLTILKSQNGRNAVYLIGTDHFSKKSAENVRDLIGIVKPKAVFLELCEERRSFIERSPNDNRVEAETSFFGALDDLRNGRINLFGLFYKTGQRMASLEFGVEGGGEFVAGYHAAKECGASVILGDRNRGVTVQRIWQGLSFFEKATVATALAVPLLMRNSKTAQKKLVENRKETDYDILDAILRTGRTSPWYTESLLFERDLYMLHRLSETFRSFDEEDSCDIVAVVGAAHVVGMTERWNMEIKYPGSELSPGKIADVLKIPGRTTDEKYISYKDLR